MSRILITGGSGFIGRAVAERFLRAGVEVRILDLVPPPGTIARDVEHIPGDLRDPAVVARAVADCEGIIHLAAELGIGRSQADPIPFLSTNLVGTAVLLEAARGAGVRPRRLLLASSMTVYGEGRYECPACGEERPAARETELLSKEIWEPRCGRCRETLAPAPTPESFPASATNVYAHTKHAQEEILRLLAPPSGIETAVLRLFNVFGPGQALDNPYTGVVAIFAACLHAGVPPVVFEDGGQLRDFVYVADVAEAFFRAWERPAAAGGTYNVGTGAAHSLSELLGLLSKEFPGAPAPRVLSRFRTGDTRHMIADVARAARDLSWSPAVSFSEGLSRTVAAAREATRSAPDLERMLRELRARGLLQGDA